ncbi:MAG: hypothetical protein K2M03_08700 [Muribaculaceae bacterium]|nr:hypothetical protein [Muribaculaceae bacterium]
MTVCFGSMILTGCSGRSHSDTNSDTLPEEDFHADNDIVMTVRSIIDAVKVNEPLDSVYYDYEGVLTDGVGRPLYTDLQGTPGVWNVDVLSADEVVIRNVYLGDLFPDDLENYIIEQTDVRPTDQIASDEYEDDDEAELSVYDFGTGYLRFETRLGKTTNGLEGPLMSIRIVSKRKA